MKLRSHARHRQDGFTLLEVLAALVILSAFAAAAWPWLTEANREQRAALAPRQHATLPPDTLAPGGAESVARTLADALPGHDVRHREVARSGAWAWVEVEIDGVTFTRPIRVGDEDDPR